MKLKSKAFTLIEISVVIIILAIIASLVFPSYRRMVGKAKQTEAKTILQSAYTAQQLYLAENDVYASSINDLDLEIPSDAKYTYTIALTSSGFNLTAKSNIDQDTALDTWVINERKQLTNSVNDIYEE